MFILDTDHLTFLEHGRGPEADRLRARLAEVHDADVAVSIMSFEEQTRGWLAFLAPARTITQQVEAYARLRRMVENYRLIPLLDFDAVAATEFQRLQ